MGKMAFQVTSLIIVYSTVYLGADQIKHQSSAPLAFVRGIHRGEVEAMEHLWWQITVGSGNGLVPSGNKLLAEPMLI